MGENQRTLLGKQPVRILMLDFSPPFTVEVGEDVCDTLENLFSLACNLSGPSRIPFFSLMVLNNYPEVLLPFSYVRNNYQRIQTALSEVRSLIQDCTGNRPTPCYYQGLAEACSQYRRQLQSSFQTQAIVQFLHPPLESLNTPVTAPASSDVPSFTNPASK